MNHEVSYYAVVVLCIALNGAENGAVTHHPANTQSFSRSGGQSLTPAVRLSAQKCGSFQVLLNDLALQSGVTLIAEGYPLVTGGSPFFAGRSEVSGDPDEILRRISNTYDYEVAPLVRHNRPSKTVYLLRKRFTDPRDLPDVTFEECHSALKDITRLMRSFGPEPPLQTQRGFVQSLWESFSAEQKDVIRQQKPIAFSDMSPGQQEQLRRMALHVHVGLEVNNFGNQLRALDERLRSVLIRKSVGSQTQTGFQISLANGRTHLYRIEGEGFGLLGMSELGLEPIDLRERHNATHTVKTLRSLLRDLQREGAMVGCEEELDDKPVTISGRTNAKPEDILAGVAQVYGLRLVIPGPEGPIQLRRERPRAPQNLDGLYDAVRQAIPEPLRRASLDGRAAAEQVAAAERKAKADPARDDQDVLAGRLSPEEAGRRYAERQRNQMEQSHESRHRSERIGWEALRRLRYGVDAALDRVTAAGPRQGVPFPELDAETRASLGLIRMCAVLRSLRSIPPGPAPGYVKDLGASRLLCQEHADPASGRRNVSVMIHPPDGQAAGLIVPDWRTP